MNFPFDIFRIWLATDNCNHRKKNHGKEGLLCLKLLRNRYQSEQKQKKGRPALGISDKRNLT